MNVKLSVFYICVETVTYLLLHNSHDSNFKECTGNNEQSNKINSENILLDNYDLPIDITFSPPSQSKNNSDVAISNRSSPSNSHIKKIEDYINKTFIKQP